jgi:hypothetical protein
MKRALVLAGAANSGTATKDATEFGIKATVAIIAVETFMVALLR